MKYFAYGSNMSIARLRKRVPSAVLIGCGMLKAHDLRFHKSSHDGSGKCDAYFTGTDGDIIYGALFEIDPDEQSDLDEAESLGHGYDAKDVEVLVEDEIKINAMTYIATKINQDLKPYSWYMNHVLIGAKELALPGEYIEAKILSIDSIEDKDKEREAKERAVHS